MGPFYPGPIQARTPILTLYRHLNQPTMSIEIIGIDHIYIAVSDLRQSEKFYDKVMRILGFHKNTFMNEEEHHIQYYNRHFGFVLRPARSLHSKHDSLAPGLHHFCFRVEDCAAVDAIAKQFTENNVDCSSPQFYLEYAPDYYAIFFTDPDGIRLEVTNYRQERRKRFEELKHV
jgi:glyoxylase I family protein